MTESLAKAMEARRALNLAEQDFLARAILDLAHTVGSDEIDPDHVQDVLQGLAEAERGDFASAEEIEAAFSAFRT